MPVIKSMKMGHHEFMVNSNIGYYPYFSVELRKRMKLKQGTNTIITGDGGLGKSYQGFDLCRVLSPKYFDVDDIVFEYEEYLRNIQTGIMFTPIEFDEPSWAMSKLEWYKQVTKALVKTIESVRYKMRPLFIPVINKNLLEKNIRSYLINFHIIQFFRGRARVYRNFASQFQDKIFSYEFCRIKYDLFDSNLCSIDSCLTCRKLNPRKKDNRCWIFRARYERKKIHTLEERYEDGILDAEKEKSRKLTLEEIEGKAMLYFDKFYDADKRKIDVETMAIILRRKEKIPIGNTRLYRLRKAIMLDYPDYFDENIDPEILKHAKMT
jgi:hypothetical protein